MKTPLLSFFIFGSINLFGQQQLTNSDFELWNTESWGVEPAYWLDPNPNLYGYGTYNFIVGIGEGDPLTTLKVTGASAAGGAGSSVLLETKSSVGQTLISQGYPIIQGILYREDSFSGEVPASISLDVKPQVLSGDTAYVYVEFRDVSDNVIKYAYQEWTNSVNSWQNVIIPVIDNATGVISKVYIKCLSSYSLNGTEVVGSKLYLDNFTFNYPCQVDNEVYLTNMAFYSSTNASSQMGVSSGYDLPSTLTPNTNNPNNFLDIGKPIRFKIKCKNMKQNGQSIVSGQCRISTSDPNIQLIDSLSGLNNVGWNSDGWSTDEFEIKVSSSVTASYTAFVDFIVIENGIEYVTPCVPIPVKPFTVSSYSIDDDANPDSQGDGDQITEPNETIEVLPLLNNTSEFDASLVKGFFLNLDNYSGIDIWNNVDGASGPVYNNSVWNYSFGQPQPIPAGTTNSSPQFDFVFDYNLGSIYSFDLYLATHGGFYLFGNNNGNTLIRTSNKLSFNSGNPQAPTSGLNLSEESLEELELYPNPVINGFMVNSKNSIQSLNIVSVDGKVTKIETDKGFYSVDGLSSGVYIVNLFFEDGKFASKKLVINN
jgi:hypothetical protein